MIHEVGALKGPRRGCRAALLLQTLAEDCDPGCESSNSVCRYMRSGVCIAISRVLLSVNQPLSVATAGGREGRQVPSSGAPPSWRRGPGHALRETVTNRVMLARRHLGLAQVVRRGKLPGSIGLRESSTNARLAKSSAHYDLVVVGSGPAAQV